jgi:hypothetical protein
VEGAWPTPHSEQQPRADELLACLTTECMHVWLILRRYGGRALSQLPLKALFTDRSWCYGKICSSTRSASTEDITYQVDAVARGEGDDVGAGDGAGAGGLHLRLDGVDDLEPAQRVGVGIRVLLPRHRRRVVQQHRRVAALHTTPTMATPPSMSFESIHVAPSLVLIDDASTAAMQLSMQEHGQLLRFGHTS